MKLASVKISLVLFGLFLFPASTLHADKSYKQICKLGLQSKGDWDEGVVDQMAEDLDESQAGKALFEHIAACRKAGIDPESALRKFSGSQIKKFEDSKLG